MITANAQLLLSMIERRGFLGQIKPLPCHLSQRNNLCDFGRAKSMQSGVPRPARKWRNLLLCTLSWNAKVDKIPSIWLFEPVKSRLFQGGNYFQEKSTFCLGSAVPVRVLESGNIPDIEVDF